MHNKIKKGKKKKTIKVFYPIVKITLRHQML